MFAKAMEAETPQPDLYPMEFGLWNWTSEGQSSYKSSNGNQVRPIVNGGVEGAETPTKSRSDMLTWNLASNLWNRCVVTLDLDASTWQADHLHRRIRRSILDRSPPGTGTGLRPGCSLQFLRKRKKRKEEHFGNAGGQVYKEPRKKFSFFTGEAWCKEGTGSGLRRDQVGLEHHVGRLGLLWGVVGSHR